MSPREIAVRMGSGTATVLDLRDSRTGEFSYGKVVPIVLGIVPILLFHAFGNALPTPIAYLLVFGTVGPSMLKVLASRVSIGIGHQVTEFEERRVARDEKLGIEPSP